MGSLVRLNTGELAVVLAVNRERVRRPRVLLITTSWGTALRTPQTLDLAASYPSAVSREITGAADGPRSPAIVALSFSAPAAAAAEQLAHVDGWA